MTDEIEYPDKIIMIDRMVEVTYRKFPSLETDPDANPLRYYRKLTMAQLKAEYKLHFIDQKKYKKGIL